MFYTSDGLAALAVARILFAQEVWMPSPQAFQLSPTIFGRIYYIIVLHLFGA